MSWPAMSLAEANTLLTAPGSPFEMEEIEIRGVRLRSWKHAPRSTREVLASSRTFGDRTFLVNDDERISFDAFHRAVVALSAHMLSRGLKKGDRVAIMSRNMLEWPLVFMAATACGAIATPLNSWWSANELEYGLMNSGASFAFMDRERAEKLADRLDRFPALQSTYVFRAGSAQLSVMLPMESVVGSPNTWSSLPDDPLPAVAIEPDDDATIFYTSGTTGHPKGALGTHRNMLTNIVGSAFSGARMFLRRGEEIPAPAADAPQQAALLAVPLFHVTGSLAIMVPSLHAGRKIVIMRRWDAEEAMRLIERERVTLVTSVPTMAWQLLENPARKKYDLSSLASLGYGGASAAPELARRIRADLPTTGTGHGWGMTETSALAAGHSAEDYANRPTSCGPSLPVGEFRIMNENGRRELPVGETGELWFKGPQVVKGYWNKPEATMETFIDGWVRTGDLARVDDEGFLYIVDRLKDILIRGGENIYCVEVENVLYEHEAVMDAALVGKPHRILGEEPVAFVTLKQDAQATESEIRAFVGARLAAFKVPIRIFIQQEPLPRNANGKILKSELRQLVAEDAGISMP